MKFLLALKIISYRLVKKQKTAVNVRSSVVLLPSANLKCRQLSNCVTAEIHKERHISASSDPETLATDAASHKFIDLSKASLVKLL